MAIVGINASFSHTMLSIRCLKAAIRDLDIDVIMKEFTVNDPVRDVADEVVLMRPDLIGLSVYIWNVDRVLKVVEWLKKGLPQAVVVLGGPETLAMDAGWLEAHPEVDMVIQGEGEAAFRRLCQALTGGSGLAIVPGLMWRERAGIVVNPPASRNNPGQELVPDPYGDSEDFSNRLVYYETSRGCPFACAYCISSLDRRVRAYPLDKVKADLSRLATSGTGVVKLVDRTFNVDEDRAREILEHWISMDSKACLHCEVVADMISADMVQFLTSLPPGRVQFEIGVQSTNKAALRAVGRRLNWEQLKKNVLILQRAGNIHLHLDLLVGLPFEDMDSLARSFNMVCSLKPHHLQMGFLKVLPGTRMREIAEEYGYEYESQAPYELITNPWLSSQDLVILHRMARVLDKVYNAERVNLALTRLAESYGNDYFRLWLDLAEEADKGGLFYGAHPLYRWLYLLAETARDRLGQEQAVEVEELIRYDLLLSHHYHNMPEPFYDQTYPADRWSEALAELYAAWPFLRDVPARAIKKRVAIHHFRTRIVDGRGPGWIAFYYGEGGGPALENHLLKTAGEG